MSPYNTECFETTTKLKTNNVVFLCSWGLVLHGPPPREWPDCVNNTDNKDVYFIVGFCFLCKYSLYVISTHKADLWTRWRRKQKSFKRLGNFLGRVKSCFFKVYKRCWDRLWFNAFPTKALFFVRQDGYDVLRRATCHLYIIKVLTLKILILKPPEILW